MANAERGNGRAAERAGLYLGQGLEEFKDGETHSLEDSYEQVQQQYVGKEQVNAEQDDGEPLGEGWRLVFIEHRTHGLQTIGAVHGAGVDVKRSIFAGKTQ